MINSKKELKFYLAADLMMNRGKFKLSIKDRLKNLIYPDRIVSYLYCMRKLQYYSNLQWGGVMRLVYKYKYSKLGRSLGFSIGYNCFGYGLVIPHYGTIVVGGSNKIGNYAVLHTSTCISDNGKIIGDGLYLSTGAKITSRIVLGNNVMVGANSVVNKDFPNGNTLIAGMPAKIIKETAPWYIKEEGIHAERVKAIECLKQSLNL